MAILKILTVNTGIFSFLLVFYFEHLVNTVFFFVGMTSDPLASRKKKSMMAFTFLKLLKGFKKEKSPL